MNGEDANRIQQLTEALQQASMAIGQAAYQADAGSPGQNGNGAPDFGQTAGNTNDEDIVEGEFEAA
jgi:hypothetical protein